MINDRYQLSFERFVFLKIDVWVNNVKTTYNAKQQPDTPCVTKLTNAVVRKDM